MNTKDEAHVQKLETEIQDMRLKDRGAVGAFIAKYGMQFIVQTLSIIIALTIGWVTINYNIDTIKKDHIVMAQEISKIQTSGSEPTQVIIEQIKTMQQDIRDIKNSQLRFEDKLDNLK